MREADVAEVWASHRYTPLGAIKLSVSSSKHAWVCWIDDIPCAILGITEHDLLSGIGTPWMLGSKELDNYRREIVYYSRDILATVLTQYDVLDNWVHADNTVAIRWLKWLGFEMGEPVAAGVEGELFRNFHLNKESANV